MLRTLRDRIRWSTLGWLLYAIGLGGVFVWNQWSTRLADPDAFYHMKMAQLIWQRGPVFDFIWLPFTTLAEHFVDQHFLVHILMIPAVAWWPEPFAGVKVFVALAGVTTIIMFGLTIKRLGWFGGGVLSAALALTIPFSFRLQLVKATPLALILLCAVLICVVERRWWWLVGLSALYVWTYGGFAMVIVVVGAWSVSQLFTAAGRAHWRGIATPLLMVIVGCVVGVVVNPYFPGNIWFYWEQLVQIGIVNYRDSISVGSEWYPYDVAQLWLGATVVVSTTMIALTTLILRRRRWESVDWFALMLAVFGLALTVKSRRYVEYWGPFTILADAIWLRHYQLRWKHIWHYAEQHWQRLLGGTALLGALLMIIVPVLLRDLEQNNVDSRNGLEVSYYRAASEWLRQHAPVGSGVIHSDWDDFPELFYYNDQAIYMAGLDPTFMYRADSQRYQLWVDISTGQYHGDLREAARTLQAQYFFIERDHVSMEQLVRKSGIATLVYSDADATIYEIN